MLSNQNVIDLLEHVEEQENIFWPHLSIPVSFSPIIHLKNISILYGKESNELLEQKLNESLEQNPNLDSLIKLQIISQYDIEIIGYYYSKLFNNLVNEEWKNLSEYIFENPSSFKFLKNFLHKRLCVFLEELIKKTCSPEYLFRNIDESFDIENI